MKDELLPLELRLLILRYGREAVSDELSRTIDAAYSEVDEQLNTLARSRKRTRRKHLPLREMISKEFAHRQELLPALLQLATKFENKEFLPTLRDVKRFMAKSGQDEGTLKSRPAAASALFRLLGSFDRETLITVSQQPSNSGDTDFAVLSRAIMRRRTTPE